MTNLDDELFPDAVVQQIVADYWAWVAREIVLFNEAVKGDRHDDRLCVVSREAEDKRADA